MKVFVSFLLIFLISEMQSAGVLCEDVNYVRTDFYIGARVKGDRIAEESDLAVEAGDKFLGIFPTSVEGIVQFDLKGNLTEGITAVKLTEQRNPNFKSKGAADVEVLSGGIGTSAIKIKVTSVKNYGLNYKAYAYGI